MRILTVNISDTVGGATRAAMRLHYGLLKEGVDSLVLVNVKSSSEKRVYGKSSWLHNVLYKIRYRIDIISLRKYTIKHKTPFSIALVGDRTLYKKINKLKPDIVHLHWIGGAMLKFEDLSKIEAPIVWSLHDDWAYTGGCHIKWDCIKYKESCQACPVLNSDRDNDLSAQLFKRKQRTYQMINNLTVVGLSRWIAKCASDSTLLRDVQVVNIPNPIDTDVFRPIERKDVRENLTLPIDKKLILFGAMNADGDVRKGFLELKTALDSMDDSNVELLIFGMNQPKKNQGFKYKVHYLGNIDDDKMLVNLYNAADVCVVPSLQENLSNVIVESLSCGTPVVGFDIGGNSDMIDHKINGYLAEAYNPVDLKNGIEFIFHGNEEAQREACRNKIVTVFSEKLVVAQYVKLYNDILNS